MQPAFFNWSGGKDSSLAFYHCLQEAQFEIKALLTNISRDYQRISMHGVPLELLQRQVQQLKIDLPLQILELWENMSMEDYSKLMGNQLQSFKAQGITHAIFGDIFLEDLRAYREEKLAEIGLNAYFPLWGRATREMLLEFIELGFKAITVAVNASLLDESFVGRVIDQEFLEELPPEVDPCGENGEFHSFVYDGPIFKTPIPFTLGEKVLKTYKEGSWDAAFWFQDLIPV